MSLPLWPKGGVKNTGVDQYNFNSSPNGEINLRTNIDEILEGRGHWVLLRRMDRTKRCSCWNKQGTDESGKNTQYGEDKRKYDEPDENCVLCGGTGWIYHEELHQSRRRLVAPALGLSAQEVQSPVGIVDVSYLVFYFKYTVRPHKEDKILEIELNTDGTPVRPFVYKEFYDVAVAEPLRDQGGRIEYWRASCKLEVV